MSVLRPEMNPESRPSRAAANRANARHSTGPKTPAGKATVARNSIGHGIYTLSPVVEGLESVADWEAYHQAMLASLDPQGMLEETLAERIILAAWRLRRTVRYETGQIGSEQEAALKQVGQRLGEDLDRKLTASDVQAILDQAQAREESLQRVAGLRTASDESPLSEDDAEDLLGHVHEHLGQAGRFDGYWEQLPAAETWTAGLLRQRIRDLTGLQGEPFDQFLCALIQRVTAGCGKPDPLVKQVKQALLEYRRKHLLPDTQTLEKVMRYESHLSRQVHRDLHELERLQALRQGQLVAAPLAVDVDVDVVGAPGLPGT